MEYLYKPGHVVTIRTDLVNDPCYYYRMRSGPHPGKGSGARMRSDMIPLMGHKVIIKGYTTFGRYIIEDLEGDCFYSLTDEMFIDEIPDECYCENIL